MTGYNGARMLQVHIKEIYHSSKTHHIGTLTWAYLVGSFVSLTVLIAIFANLAEEVREGDTLPVDEAILEAIRTGHTPLLDLVAQVGTNLGGVIGIVALTGIALTALLVKKRYRALMQLGLGVGGAVALNIVLKNIFERARPDLWEQIVHEASYSFPSGHAMASSALALSIVLIAWQTKWRWWAVGAASVYVLFIGFTRMYLGVHYPSDILGGWLMSATWVIIVALALGTIRIRQNHQ